MLKNAYSLAKIGADAAENEQHFAEMSVWMVQSTKPQDDAVGLVQPTPERMGTIKEANEL